MTEPAYSFAFALRPTSVSEARARLRDVLRRADVPAAAVEDSALVLSELVTNAIRHAHPAAGDEACVEIRLTGSRLHLTVIDGGAVGAPVAGVPPSGDPGGRGLSLVELLADRWWWEPSAGGRAVHAVLQLPERS